jgi:hypothetical protein
VERLDHLVAGPGRVRERVEPDVDPGADVVDRVVQEQSADGEEDEPDDEGARPPGRDVEEEQEDEEEERLPQVALDDDDGQPPPIWPASERGTGEAAGGAVRSGGVPLMRSERFGQVSGEKMTRITLRSPRAG